MKTPRSLQGWHALRTELALYYGAYLHRRLFVWFGAAMAVTALAMGKLVSVFGTIRGHGALRPVLVFGLPFLILWTVAGRIARRIARPLYRLAQVANEIGAGNWGARAKLPSSNLGEIAALSHALDHMARRIEKQMKDQRELLAGVSHELRTPLGHMRVLIELVREHGLTGDALSDLEHEVLEIDALVAELLASARLDFQTLNRQPLDAAEVAARALDRARVPLAVLQVETADLGFTGDPTLMARALGNLLANAHKHGGGVVAVRIQGDPTRISFLVEDGGPGFAPGEEARVFAAFYRGDATTRERTGDRTSEPTQPTDDRTGDFKDDPRNHSRNDTGNERHGESRNDGAHDLAHDLANDLANDLSLGLGLALVARIARAHGGTVQAHNLAQGGACVRMDLQRAQS